MEFTQNSWATSPFPVFSGVLSIMSSEAEFYNSELKLSLTQQIQNNNALLGSPKSLLST